MGESHSLDWEQEPAQQEAGLGLGPLSLRKKQLKNTAATKRSSKGPSEMQRSGPLLCLMLLLRATYGHIDGLFGKSIAKMIELFTSTVLSQQIKGNMRPGNFIATVPHTFTK